MMASADFRNLPKIVNKCVTVYVIIMAENTICLWSQPGQQIRAQYICS